MIAAGTRLVLDDEFGFWIPILAFLDVAGRRRVLQHIPIADTAAVSWLPFPDFILLRC